MVSNEHNKGVYVGSEGPIGPREVASTKNVILETLSTPDHTKSIIGGPDSEEDSPTEEMQLTGSPENKRF